MRRIAATLAVVGALLFSAGAAWADFDDGWAAYERGDYVTAFREMRPLAEQGHALAQLNLGNMYVNGEGVSQNYTEAVKWFRKAAEQGIAQAQFNLGFMYEHGRGVAESDVEAAKWWRKAAEQDLGMAQLKLGIKYALGEGVPEDYVKAYMWLSLAQSQGVERAAEGLDLLKEGMTYAQIAEAKTLAFYWRKKPEWWEETWEEYND